MHIWVGKCPGFYIWHLSITKEIVKEKSLKNAYIGGK